MTLLALLVSTDDSVCEVLGRVLPASGIAVERFSDLSTALDRLQQQRFDCIVVDFQDQQAAEDVLKQARQLNSGIAPVTVALVPEPTRARDILSGGAHFILYKPLSDEKAKTGLRAVAALLNRERRRAQRVPVQAPVELTLADGRAAEGILLDLSQTGMDVLTAEEQAASALLNFHFELPDKSLRIEGHGQVAWANPNGQTGVHFLDLDETTQASLEKWLQAAATALNGGADETVPHCKLSDLSLGGCYVESDSPFPERALVDLCLRTEDVAVHTEGMVRVNHPGYGMGIEFPSRTPEQRAQVGNLISFLRGCPESMLAVNVSPRALRADLTQFERAPEDIAAGVESDEMDDPLLELLRQGPRLQQDEFLCELRRQRSGEEVSS